jgi:rhodanese-related sulfurtransferase
MTGSPILPAAHPSIGWAQTGALIPLKYMSEAHLAVLLETAQVHYLYPEQTLWQRGAMDGRRYFLWYGELRLEAAAGPAQHLKGRDTLEAISPREPRRHHVSAVADSALLSVDAVQLDKLLCWSQVADYLHTIIARDPDLDEDIDWMMQVLRSNLFFKVPPINIKHIFSNMQVRLVEPGERVIRQGESGDQCYFIKEGRAQVTRSANGVTNTLATIDAGRCFGEDALVNEAPRNASVTMLTKGVLMCLPKQDFYPLLKPPQVPQAAWQAIKRSRADTVIVDVRSEAEYSTGHLAGAVNLPLHLLAIKARLLQPSVPYVLYCDTGRRARAATHLLREQGFRVQALADCAAVFADDTQWPLESRDNYVLRAGRAVRGQ